MYMYIDRKLLLTSGSPNDRGGDVDEAPADSFLAGGTGGGCRREERRRFD